MGVRCGTRELSQLPLDLVMMGAYERFQETGDPVEYCQIAPALWTSPTYPSAITTLEGCQSQDGARLFSLFHPAFKLPRKGKRPGRAD
jgi:hypothetical protein